MRFQNLNTHHISLERGLCLRDDFSAHIESYKWLSQEKFAYKEKTKSKLIEIVPTLYTCPENGTLEENKRFIESRGLRLLTAVELVCIQLYFYKNHNLKILAGNSSMTSSFSNTGERVAVSSYLNTPIYIVLCNNAFKFGLGVVLCKA